MITATLYDVDIRLVRPLRTSRGTYETLDGVIVGIDDGRDHGWGEATPVPGFGVLRASQISEKLEVLAVDALRADDDVETLLQMLDGRFSDVPAARFAAVGAALDLVSRQARRPLAAEVARRIAAPDPARRVHSAALLSGDDTDSLVASATSAVADGFDTVKVKVGAGTLADDVAAVSAIRAAVGPDVGIRLDANGAWDLDAARTAVEELGPFGIDLLEEPTSGLREIDEVAARVEVTVAVDESIETIADLTSAAGAAPAVVVKPARLGSPTAVATACRAVARAGARVVITSQFDGSVARATAAAVAAVLQDHDERHGLSTGRMLAADVTAEPWGCGPVARVDTGPGLGFDPDL